jgi:transposase-like protein
MNMDTAKSSSKIITEDDCIQFLEHIRWHGKPTCPYCHAQKSTPMKDGRHHCNGCGVTYSVTVQTIFHRSHLSLDKWFLAIRLIIVSHGNISARKLAEGAKINRNTAWQIIDKVYTAMAKTDERQLLLSIVEMQE